MLSKEDLDWIFIETSTAIIMARLESEDIDLIRHSWSPAMRDTKAAGLLLFKGLFTKFPEYLKLFPQFGALDVERLHESTRLVRHATKVIDTVAFVVDCIGDDAKAGELSDALLALVRSHLKRSIGLEAFRNLGIVLLDFICALNHSYQGSLNSQRSGKHARGSQKQNNSSSNGNATAVIDDANHLNYSLTSSSGGCSADDELDEDDYANNGGDDDDDNNDESEINMSDIEIISSPDAGFASQDRHKARAAAFDTNAVVAAWTKLYSNILELVKSEEKALAAAASETSKTNDKD